MISGRNVWAKISLKTLHIKTYFLKSLHFGYFKICEPKWVTKMERNGLQKCTVLGYKNSKNRYPQNRLTSVECILDMSPKNIQNGKCISLYNRRIYSLVCRYKTHEASHGISRGWPHILVQWGFHLPVAVRILMSFDTVQKTYW